MKPGRTAAVRETDAFPPPLTLPPWVERFNRAFNPHTTPGEADSKADERHSLRQPTPHRPVREMEDGACHLTRRLSRLFHPAPPPPPRPAPSRSAQAQCAAPAPPRPAGCCGVPGCVSLGQCEESARGQRAAVSIAGEVGGAVRGREAKGIGRGLETSTGTGGR